MAEQKQGDQLKHTYSSYVRIRDVALKTYQRRWMIGRSGERESWISMLAARHNDDDEFQSSFFFSNHFVTVQVVQLYCITDITTAYNNSHFLSERSDFYLVVKLSIAVHVLSTRMLTSPSVDKILLLSYINWYANFRDLPFNQETVPSWLKYMNFVLSELTSRPNESCYLLHIMQHRFALTWSICKKAVDHLRCLYQK